MGSWSPKNATEAYLSAMKMGKKGNEPDASELISAIAAGNNSQLMVLVCAGAAGSKTLALVAAANQTGGRVVCVLQRPTQLPVSKAALGPYADRVEFIAGDAGNLLLSKYRGADFVLIDCEIHDHNAIFMAARKGAKPEGAVIVGCNALGKASTEMEARFLPIGKGLVVSRRTGDKRKLNGGLNRGSRWVVEIDKATGEEHFYRITSPRRQQIELQDLRTFG